MQANAPGSAFPDNALVADVFSAVDRLQDGIAITDASGVYTYMNQSHAAMFDYGSPAELIGKPWSAIYQPDVADWFQQFVMPRLFSNGAWRGEAVGISATGRLVPQEVSLTVSAGGGIICATRDITARKQDEALFTRLREWLADAEMQAQVQHKLDRTCHDIANFLLAADARLAAAQTIAARDDRLSPHLDRLAAALAGARETAASARSKNDAGASDPPPSLDLVALAVRAGDLAAREEGRTGRLNVITEVNAAYGDVDPIIVMRALMNLLRNAFEAGGERDVEMIVAATPPPFPAPDAPNWRSREALPVSRVTISIRDYGCGIAPDHLSQIFNAYFSTKTGIMVANRGLGLDAVMELVARTDGVVSVQSIRGLGSQFDLILPASVVLRSATSAPRVLEGLHRKVAVVDDDPQWVDRIERELASRGFTIARFARPEEALQAIDDGDLDLSCMVIDFHFGGTSALDGAELATRISASGEPLQLVCFSSAQLEEHGPFHAVIDKRGDIAALGDVVTRLSAIGAEASAL